MPTTENERASRADEIQARMDEALRESGQEIRDQLRRADELIFKSGRPGRIGELFSLGPHDGDDYIAEEIQRGRGTETIWYRVVVGGKLLNESSETKDFALMLYLAATNDSNGRTDGARWAARTLGIPNGWDS